MAPPGDPERDSRSGRERRVIVSEEHYRVLAEMVREAIVTIDPSGAVVSANRGVERVFGWRPEEIVGRPFDLLVPGYRDRMSLESVVLEEDGTSRRTSWELVEMDGRSRAGERVPLEVSFSGFQRSGQRLMAAVVREVSGRKRAERRLAAKFEVTHLLAQARAIEDAAPRLVEVLCQTTGARAVALFLEDAQGERLRCAAVNASGDPQIEEFGAATRELEIARGQGVAGRVWDSSEATFSRLSDEEHGLVPQAVDAAGIRSIYAVPIIDGHVVGVLELFSRSEGPPDDDASRMLDAVGEQLGQFITRKHVERERAELLEREREARRTAEESEERYRALAELIPHLVWIVRADGTHEYTSRRMHEYLGGGVEMLKGDDWPNLVHPDDRPRALQAWRRTLADGTRYEVEYRLRRADGAYRWFLARGFPLPRTAGEQVRVIGTCTDIDDQKRAERAQRFLADAGAALSSTLEPEKALRAVANLSVPFLGDGCLVELAVEDGRFRRVSSDREDPEKIALATRLTRGAPDVPRAAATGEPELADSVISVPLRARGRVLGAITFVAAESGRRYDESAFALAQELAARASLAVENARLYREAERAIEMRDNFAAVVSHELRNLLAVILMKAELLRRGVRTPLAQADAIKRSADQMKRLIDDLLDLASLEAGKFLLERRRQAASSLLDEAFEHLQPLAAAKGQKLEKRIAPDVGELDADRERLLQVFANLGGNAVKFTPAGGSIVLAAARDGDAVRFEVVDTGPGIAEADLAHVFDRFWRVKQGYRQGTGLGLSIAKGIVDAHGGQIGVTSRPGEGTRLAFTIPAAPATASAAQEAAVQ